MGVAQRNESIRLNSHWWFWDRTPTWVISRDHFWPWVLRVLGECPLKSLFHTQFQLTQFLNQGNQLLLKSRASSITIGKMYSSHTTHICLSFLIGHPEGLGLNRGCKRHQQGEYSTVDCLSYSLALLPTYASSHPPFLFPSPPHRSPSC